VDIITLKDFQDISDKTPLLADLKPSGKYLGWTCTKLGSSCGNKYLLKKDCCMETV
jgi:dihydroxy-acid dehydratase